MLFLNIQRAYGGMNLHSVKALQELSSSIRRMTVPVVDMSKAMEATDCLISELSDDTTLLQVMHIAVVLSRLSDLVSQINKITEAIDHLARLAQFKKPTRRQVDVVIDVVG